MYILLAASVPHLGWGNMCIVVVSVPRIVPSAIRKRSSLGLGGSSRPKVTGIEAQSASSLSRRRFRYAQAIHTVVVQICCFHFACTSLAFADLKINVR